MTDALPENEAGRSGYKRLYKSRRDRVFFGVCGGLGEYFNVDPKIIRIIWVISAFAGGVGILGYIICALIISENPGKTIDTEPQQVTEPRSGSSSFALGAILIVIGFLFIFRNWRFPFDFPHWLNPFWFFNFHFGDIWPFLLIILGILYIIHVTRQPAPEKNVSAESGSSHAEPAGRSSIYRSRKERKLCGVCGGFGAFFNIDPVFIRVLWIIASFYNFFFSLIVYIGCCLIFPEESPKTEGDH